MNNKNEIITTSGKETDKWVKKLTKIVVPFLNSPIIDFKNIIGSGFLLNYKKVLFLVTAKHIKNQYELKNINPYFLITYLDQTYKLITTEKLKKFNNFWLDHEKLDISVISLNGLEILTDKIVDIGGYPEYKIHSPIGKPVDKEAVILGFPFGDTSNYKDGSKSYFCQKLQGKIFKFEGERIIFQIKDMNNRNFLLLDNKPGGLSGGPIILNDNNEGKLIGICTEMLPLNDPIINKITNEDIRNDLRDSDKYGNYIVGNHLHQVLELLEKFF